MCCASARASASASVSVSVCVTSTVDNVYVCIACLCPLCETGCFWRVSPHGVFLLSCVGVCMVTLAPVVCLHDSRYSYGVLLCADAWPVWESMSVSVWYENVFVVKLLASTVGVSDAQLASTGDVAQSTRCTFPVVDIWYYLIIISLECTCL